MYLFFCDKQLSSIPDIVTFFREEQESIQIDNRSANIAVGGITGYFQEFIGTAYILYRSTSRVLFLCVLLGKIKTFILLFFAIK